MLKAIYDWHIPDNPYRTLAMKKIMIWTCLVLPMLTYVYLGIGFVFIPGWRLYFLAMFCGLVGVTGLSTWFTNRALKRMQDLDNL